MTQVSKRQLTKDVEERIFDSFWRVVVLLKKKDEVSIFFSDFFTNAEKVNFAKRISIAILLSKGYDYFSIRDVLKVSTSTIGRVALKIDNPGWKLFIKKLEDQEDWEKFWHDLELLMFRFTGGGRRAFKSDEELEAIMRKKS